MLYVIGIVQTKSADFPGGGGGGGQFPMHYFPDAFTYFGILFLLIFYFNVNMRLFSFGFQTILQFFM